MAQRRVLTRSGAERKVLSERRRRGALGAGTFAYGTAGFRAKAVCLTPPKRGYPGAEPQTFVGARALLMRVWMAVQDTLASTVFRSGVLAGLRALDTKACTGISVAGAGPTVRAGLW